VTLFLQVSASEKQTALHVAVEWSAIGQIIMKLIDAGVPIHAKEHTGFDALHFAAWKNRLEPMMVRMAIATELSVARVPTLTSYWLGVIDTGTSGCWCRH
jgi:phage-related protein